MIVVTVTLHSSTGSPPKVLGHALIANTGEGTVTVGQYTAKILKASGGVWKEGRVDGFPRKRLGPWDLLYRVLREAVGDRNE